MFLRIVIVHRAGYSLRKRLARIENELAHFGRLTVGITAKVQAALDGIRQTQSIVIAVRDGIALQGDQIKNLQQAVLDAQKKAEEGKIGPDDLAAIAEITSDIDQVNADLRTAIPANTPPELPQGTPQPSDTGQQVNGLQPEGGLSVGAEGSEQSAPEPAQPTAEEQAQHEQDAAAAAQAKPLGGTG